MNYGGVLMVSPIVAAIISFFFPGIGQVVQGETQKGIIMFVAAIVISIILTYALGTIGNKRTEDSALC